MNVRLNLYQLKQVGRDFIVLGDAKTVIKITFADRERDHYDLAPTKEEEAAFFKHVNCLIGLEDPVTPLHVKRSINIFMDHLVDSFGTLRSVPFPFQVSSIEMASNIKN